MKHSEKTRGLRTGKIESQSGFPIRNLWEFLQTSTEMTSSMNVGWTATIELASQKTGVPISSVGYYFKKLDRYAGKGIPIPSGAERSIEASVDDVLERNLLSHRVEDLERAGKFREARELILLYQAKKVQG